jgi:hypothetical protein
LRLPGINSPEKTFDVPFSNCRATKSPAVQQTVQQFCTQLLNDTCIASFFQISINQTTETVKVGFGQKNVGQRKKMLEKKRQKRKTVPSLKLY